MPDRNWLRNLATAQFEKGQWHLEPQTKDAASLKERVQKSLIDLYSELQEATEIFNYYAKTAEKISVFASKLSYSLVDGAIILIHKNLQITLNMNGDKLIANLTSVQGFDKDSKLLHSFTPTIDAFGSFLWRLENGLIMNNQFITQLLFEEITRLSHSSEETR